MDSYTLNYNVEKTSSGFIGQCIEFPYICTEAKTKADLDKEMGIVLDGYFKVYPQAHKDIKKSAGYDTCTIKNPT